MANAMLIPLVSALLALLAPSTLASDPWDETWQRFARFDANGDGIDEIETLRRLFPQAAGPATGRRLLVLVEQRVVDPTDDAAEVTAGIAQLERDLAAEGFLPCTLVALLHRGPPHQDGRTLLALREMFRTLRKIDPSFAGALLIGSFPEAFLVCSCNWRRKDTLTFRAGTPEQKIYTDVDNLRTAAEPIAIRAELILCDLDGRWDELYVEPRVRLPTLVAAFPGGVPRDGGIATDFERTSVSYQDFFHVNDGRVDVSEVVAESGEVTGLHVVPRDDLADQECSPGDLERPNRMARPDILVSRIDAHGVALSLKPRFRDEDGLPRRVEFPDEAQLPSWADEPWEFDLALERRLLVEYLDRNHRYRTGSIAPAFRPASIECGLGSGYDVLRAAAPEWSQDDPERASFDLGGAPSLVDVAEWLKRPAILRTIRAHSDPWGSVFAPTDAAALAHAAGGVPWSFTPYGHALIPSLQSACAGGKLDWFLLRTLWSNHVLPEDGASFYLHTGCDAISPGGAWNQTYDQPGYSLRQGGEALLFLAQGLALVGRAKVFYDEPRGFCDALREGRNFGEAWARYFEIESSAATWAEVGDDIGRKRAYFWSVIGDWTLTLQRGK